MILSRWSRRQCFNNGDDVVVAWYGKGDEVECWELFEEKTWKMESNEIYLTSCTATPTPSSRHGSWLPHPPVPALAHAPILTVAVVLLPEAALPLTAVVSSVKTAYPFEYQQLQGGGGQCWFTNVPLLITLRLSKHGSRFRRTQEPRRGTTTTAEPSSPPRFISSRHPRWHQRRGADHGEPFGVIAQHASQHQYPAVPAASVAAVSDAVGRTVSSRDQGGPRAVWRERSWGREMLDGCQSFAVALVMDKRRRGRE